MQACQIRSWSDAIIDRSRCDRHNSTWRTTTGQKTTAQDYRAKDYRDKRPTATGTSRWSCQRRCGLSLTIADSIPGRVADSIPGVAVRPRFWTERFFSVCLNLPPLAPRLTSTEAQEGNMLAITLLKSAMLIAGLALTSVFLQMALSYGNLPLIIGQ